jgi:hypothetical protein
VARMEATRSVTQEGLIITSVYLASICIPAVFDLYNHLWLYL